MEANWQKRQGQLLVVGKPKKAVSLAASESDIQKAILKVLSMHTKVAWSARFNTGAMKTGTVGNERYVRFGFPGCPDILGQLKDGRVLAIEVKKPGGRVSPGQLSFITKVCANHGVGAVVYSVTDVENLLREA